MGLLERLIGADAARDFRDRMVAASAAAQAAQAARDAPTASQAPAAPGSPAAPRAERQPGAAPALRTARAPGAMPASGGDPAQAGRLATGATIARGEARSASAGSPGSNVAASAAERLSLADPLGLAGLAAGDFPTSILATVAESAPPLLSAFANRSALLAAVVFSEALAPPVALR